MCDFTVCNTTCPYKDSKVEYCEPMHRLAEMYKLLRRDQDSWLLDEAASWRIAVERILDIKRVKKDDEC
jgi:hypothetical protein